MNKKGTAFDMALISVFIVIFLLVSVIMLTILNSTNTSLQTAGVLSPVAEAQLDSLSARYPKILDGLLSIILVGLTLSAVISAFAIRSHPIFFFVTVILLFILGFVNLILKDVYFAITQNSAFSASASQFILGTWVMTKFPFILAVLGILVAIITYSRGAPEI